MPSSEVPDLIKPYRFLGLTLTNKSKEWFGDCPFCQSERKFSINEETGKWKCFVCMEGSGRGGGNIYTFLKLLYLYSQQMTADLSYTQLAEERRFQSADTPKAWGAVQSVITGEWLVPGYGLDGKLLNLYRWRLVEGKRRLQSTSTLKQRLLGVHLYDPSKPYVYLCEGFWDGCAMWETLGNLYAPEGGDYDLIVDRDESLLSQVNVLAVPGAGIFVEEWGQLFYKKEVTLLYHNDHMRVNAQTGREVTPPGLAGMRRVSQIFSTVAEKPAKLSYLTWGGDEHGGNKNLKDGYDLRDHFAHAHKKLASLGDLYKQVKDWTHPIPADWIQGRAERAVEQGLLRVQLKPCTNFKALRNAWQYAMEWTEGLDISLSVILATVVSTDANGDQLWLILMGPASSGKSTLLEAISTNADYVFPKDNIRGFHSGYKSDKDGTEDHSLVPKIKGKTLVTKDGDTLLQTPNLGQILSEARSLYDRNVRVHYRHAVDRDYRDVSMTWIIAGTSSIKALDRSELGQRFLICKVMDGIDGDVEDMVLERKANEEFDRYQKQGDTDGVARGDGPELLHAKLLTGGYVDYLRKHAFELMRQVRPTDLAKRKCVQLAKFISFMRARPSLSQEELTEREFGARLLSQVVRLAVCLAVVMNKTEIDDEVMSRVRKVALDTANGRTLEVAAFLYTHTAYTNPHLKIQQDGIDLRTLAKLMTETETKIKPLVKFMRQIRAVESYEHSKTANGTRVRWRLTKELAVLYRDLLAPGEAF